MSGHHDPDQRTEKDLKKALRSDKDLKGYGISAEVVDGEARLQGVVDTLIEKERAGRLSAGVPGVKKVDCALAVSTDGPITDSEVEFEVAEEFMNTPGVNPKHIWAESHRGTVVLKGVSPSSHEVEAARRAAAKARGVKEIINQVKLKEPQPTLKEVFHSQVRNDNEKG